MGDQSYGIDPAVATQIAKDVAEIQGMGVETAIVIGGGNIFRGVAASARGMDRATADYMGMRAMEIKAEVILKATKVDGIYNADPVTHPEASRYDRISYLQVLEQGLKVMDATAISLCMDNRLPIVVFNLRTPGNIRRAISGESIGSLVTA